MTFAVILHGTGTILYFIDNFGFSMTDFTLVPNGGATDYGFTRFYKSFSFVDPVNGPSQSLQDYLASLDPDASFTVAGFSLGGPLAT
ncbi:MAG: hypothetical protein K6T63_02415 [Alicyclobacillus herbarius]|uniref:lipase family protein n=1 Tax=Alicyclobacillus herbarius TaxID=122960 RepID=UPI0009D73816|nr:hypothetical protein [Alicyclobacillus herbarius]MCL6631461.1 hypothetical protein [Alicyclobacillus herbarius]